MFQENLDKSIGLLLKANGHELVKQNADCIFYVKRLSDGLAFHVRCFHYGEYQSSVMITLFFTSENVSYENITTTTVGVQMPIIVTEPEQKWDAVNHKLLIINDDFPMDIILAAGKKVLAIEEAFGQEARDVILEELHV